MSLGMLRVNIIFSSVGILDKGIDQVEVMSSISELVHLALSMVTLRMGDNAMNPIHGLSLQ